MADAGSEQAPAAEAVAQAMAPVTAAAEPVNAAPVAPAAQAAAPTSAPAAASNGLPKVRAFDLPVSQLQSIAEGSGLQWVNSDADKVAAVQAAIAAEPKPVHVPRERPAPVVIDEGPLVLVETRRDLSQVQLPFETAKS